MTPALLLLTTFALTADGDEAALAERKRLEGSWKVVAGEIFGRTLDDRDLDVAEIVIAGDRLTLKKHSRTGPAVPYRLAPERTPKQLDLLGARDRQVQAWRCIYALEGDELKLCLPLVQRGRGQAEVARPENLDTTNRAHLLLTARRQKP